MAIDVRRRPGRHAEERARSGLRTRRRAVRRDRSLWLAVGLGATMLVFALVSGGSAAWFSTGVIVGTVAMALVAVLGVRAGPERGRPAGAEGERATAVALGPLEAAD